MYSETNYFQLQRRLEEIAQQVGVAGPTALHALAQKELPSDVRGLLLDVATNNETSFFRDAQTFRALDETLVPTLRARGVDHVRIWSAAASTGQEAYSIAFTLDALRKRDPAAPDFSILASDISDRVLQRAQEGVYTQLEVMRGLPARLLVDAFEKRNEKTWAVKPHYLRKVDFRRLNLLGAWPGLPKFDIIFLRNVLIYQSVANKERILRRVHDQLAAGGFLVLGASENLLGVSHPFRLEPAHGGHIYTR